MYWYWRDITYHANQFYLGTFVLLTGVWFMETSWWALKHKSPKLIWNDGHTSTTGYYLTAGDYAIFRLGGINWGVQYEGKTGA